MEWTQLTQNTTTDTMPVPEGDLHWQCILSIFPTGAHRDQFALSDLWRFTQIVWKFKTQVLQVLNFIKICVNLHKIRQNKLSYFGLFGDKIYWSDKKWPVITILNFLLQVEELRIVIWHIFWRWDPIYTAYLVYSSQRGFSWLFWISKAVFIVIWHLDKRQNIHFGLLIHWLLCTSCQITIEPVLHVYKQTGLSV